MNGHQMYSGGSAIGKASTTDPEISLTPFLIFTEGQKVRNLASFSTLLHFEPPAFENATTYPNSETNLHRSYDRSMFSPCLMKFSPCIPAGRVSVSPLNLHGENVLNS